MLNYIYLIMQFKKINIDFDFAKDIDSANLKFINYILMN